MAGELNGQHGTVTCAAASMKIQVVNHRESVPTSDVTGYGDTIGQTAVGKRRITFVLQGQLLSGTKPTAGMSANIALNNWTITSGSKTYVISDGVGKIVDIDANLPNEGPWTGRLTVAVNEITAG